MPKRLPRTRPETENLSSLACIEENGDSWGKIGRGTGHIYLAVRVIGVH